MRQNSKASLLDDVSDAEQEFVIEENRMRIRWVEGGEEILDDDTVELSDMSKSNTVDEEITLSELINYFGFARFQWTLLVATGLAFCGDGIEILMLSFLMPLLKAEWNLDAWAEASIASVSFVGWFLGASFWGFLSDLIGRKKSWVCVLSGILVFALLQLAAQELWHLLVFRGFLGFCIGGTHIGFSLFAEYLPTQGRGGWLILYQGWFSVGAFLASGLAYLMLDIGKLHWRWFVAISVLPIVLAALCIPWLPESVRWLGNHKREAEMMSNLQKLAKLNGKPLPAKTLVMYVPSKKEEAPRCSPKSLIGPMKMLFNTRANAKVTVLMFLIWFVCSFAYYGLVFMSPPFFDAVFSNAYLLSVATSSAEIPFMVITGLAIGRLGRKYTMVAQFALCGLFTFGFGFKQAWASVACAFVSRGFIAGAFCSTWVYTPELFSTENRTTAVGFCSGASRIAGIITPFIGSVLRPISIWLPLGIYAGSCVLAALFALMLSKDTTGTNLSDRAERASNVI